MKKVEKNISFWDRKINLIVDEKLNKLKGKILAPKKLEEANNDLSKMKCLPK
ncbi:hypothetical protein ACX0G9_30995 [Flavitalea flava]